MRLATLLTFALIACSDTAPSSGPRILLFTRTAAFRHTSIATAITAVRSLGSTNGFMVEDTENPQAFTDVNLGRFAAVIFLLTTGDVLNADQQTAVERFVRAGHGFVGVHSATDTEYDWPWYGELVGAYFASHPAIQGATIRVTDASHPSTSGLPATLSREDEWYNFRDDPSSRVHVLVRLDETSYSGGTMGASHPISWYHSYDGGRAWYTAMGHTEGTWSEPAFLTHLAGGIRWAAGLSP